MPTCLSSLLRTSAFAPVQVASKLTSARSALSSSATAQVEAMRYGMQLLDKSHR
jgi:hypothetical protein